MSSCPHCGKPLTTEDVARLERRKFRRALREKRRIQHELAKLEPPPAPPASRDTGSERERIKWPKLPRFTTRRRGRK